MEENKQIIENLNRILTYIEGLRIDYFDSEVLAFIHELLDKTFAIKSMIDDSVRAIENFENRNKCEEKYGDRPLYR